MNTSERKCGHCGNDDGHAKKGCTGIKLFGVQIAAPSDGAAESTTIRKSKSLGNLQSCIADKAAAAAVMASGYLSDGFVHQSTKSNQKKRGKPWSEDEHRSFLAGLEKLGKGDWKGISTNYVPSRSSTQVASHAQKYFNRLAGVEKRRRRASVFDIPLTHEDQPPNKADESSVQASSNAAASNKVSEPKGQAARVFETCLERPPPSPMKKRGIPGYLPTMPRHSRFTVPTLLPCLPVVNFSSQSYTYSIHGYLSQPSSVATLPQGSSYLTAGSALQTPKNDELNLNIRKLKL